MTVRTAQSHYTPATPPVIATTKSTAQSKHGLAITKSKGHIIPSGTSLNKKASTAAAAAPVVPPTPPEPQEKRPPWAEWVELNAQPRNYFYPRPKREVTRWQKRGPMSRRDWVRFYHWATEKATPRPDGETIMAAKQAKKELELQKKMKAQESKKKRRKSKKETKPKKTKAELYENIQKLSKPRVQNQKYDYPPEPDYPYSPQIDFKVPATKDRGRPFPVPKVPRCFQHRELEIDWWSKLRFPVRQPAMKCTPSAKIIQLAKPRVVPPVKQHCPIPPPVPEVIPKRQRMNYRQWQDHLVRLLYLAKPHTSVGY